MHQDITLNIHYTIPKSLWKIFLPFIEEMKDNGIKCSIEPEGLRLYTENEIPQCKWEALIDNFCEKASEIPGFAVGDACGDFECIPFK